MTVRTTIEQAAKTVMGALSPTEGEADILDTLEAEHDEVQELLTRLVDSDDARRQKSLVLQIKQALIPHSKAEEAVVYDAVIALSEKDAKIEGSEGYLEHSLSSATLQQLERLTANTPEFMAAAKVLKELLDHHIKEEEDAIWDQVKSNFTGEQRAQMNRTYLAAKKDVALD